VLQFSASDIFGSYSRPEGVGCRAHKLRKNAKNHAQPTPSHSKKKFRNTHACYKCKVHWIKIYVFRANTAAATTTLELLAQGRVNVAGVETSSTTPVDSVYVGTCPGWLTPGGFTDKTAPQTSTGWTLSSTTNENQYFLVVETYGHACMHAIVGFMVLHCYISHNLHLHSN
jgi:hypothetical protein